MESAIQVDLARREAPASQVLDSALGTAAFGLNASNSTSAVAEDTHSDESSRRPPRIGYPTTNQIRLDSKASRNNEPSEVDQAGSTAPGIELGQVSDGRLAFKLPKVDEGFGAWSYVAGAFAMYIVVWGQDAYEYAVLRLTLTHRLPTSVSHLPDAPYSRSLCYVPGFENNGIVSTRYSRYPRGSAVPNSTQGSSISAAHH